MRDNPENRMKWLPWTLMLGCSAALVQADGLSPMPLADVLPQAEVVVVAEIVSNRETITETRAPDLDPVVGGHSFRYAYQIRFKVTERLKGMAPDEVELCYEMVVVKGAWLAWPGSGLEGQMKPGERYVLLLTRQKDAFRLLRAEKVETADSIREFLNRPLDSLAPD